MIALFIFMIIMLGLAKGQIAALQTHTGNVFRDEALRLAEDELCRLKSLQFSLQGTDNQLNPAAWAALPAWSASLRGTTIAFNRSVQITDIATAATTMKQIDVAVGWTQGNGGILFAETNRNRQTSVSTIIVQSN